MTSWGHYLVNVAAQGGSRAFSLAAAFGAYVLVARVLGSEVLGQLAFLMAFVAVAANLADLGTTAALARGLAQEVDRDPGAYFGNYLMLRGLLAGAVIALAIASAFVIAPALLHPLLICCLAVPLVAARFFETVYQVLGRARYSMYASLVLGTAQISIAAALLLWLEVGLTGYIYGFFATQIIYCSVAMALALRLVAPVFRVRRKTLRSIMLLAAPMGVSALFYAIYTRADIFMLSYLRSDHEVGIYNAAYRLLDLAVLVAVTAATPLVPVLARKLAEDHEATRRACMRIMELVVIIGLPVPLVTAYVAEPVMTGIFGPGFRESAVVLPIFAWLFLLTGYTLMGSSINLAAGNVGYGYWSTAITACLNIAFNYFLIPRYGVLGAAWATLASTVFMLAVSQYYVRESVGNIYALGRWVKILGAALLFRLCLAYTIGEHLVLPIAASLMAYFAAVALAGLLPLAHLRALASPRGRRRG